MTSDGWRTLVVDAVHRAEDGDPTLLDLVTTVLAEQEDAKEQLRQYGFSCVGSTWAEVVDAAIEAQA